MAKGVIYKSNGSTWSKTVVKDTSNGTGTTFDEGVVKHYGGTTWYDNYPMEQEYEQYFSPTWSKAYQSANLPLDSGVWGDQLWSGGSSMQAKTLIGYDRTSINNFVTTTGQVLEIKVRVNLVAYTHNGNGTAYFAPHTNTSQPSTYNSGTVNKTYNTSKNFIKGAWGAYWITLPLTAYTSMNKTMAGVCIYSTDNSDVNSLQFSGKSAFNSQLYIRVLK